MSSTYSPQFPNNQKSSNSPYKTAKFKQYQRYRSQSPNNRSFSTNSRNLNNNNNNNNNNSSHNTSSIHSQYLKNALQQIQLFPPICMQILKHEQHNIIQYKKSLTKQKNRINSQIQATLIQINHIVQDYRLSLIAVLDRIYQQYISKYTQLKTEIIQINRMKQQVQQQYPIKQQNLFNAKNNISNIQTIKTMQANQTQFKKYQIMNYVAQLQKQKMGPLNQLSQYLLILSQYDNGFFQIQQFRKYMNQTKASIRTSFRQALGQTYAYIRDPDNIVFKQIGKNRENPTFVQPQRDKQVSYHDIQGLNMPYSNPLTKRRQPKQNINITQNNNYQISSQRQQFKQPIRHPSYRQHQISVSQVPNNLLYPTNMNYQQIRPPQASKSQPYLVYQRDSQIQQMRTQYSQQNLKQKLPSPISINQKQHMGSTSQIRRNLNSVRQMPTYQQQLQYNPTSHPQVILSSHKISADSIRVSQQIPFSFKSKGMDVILCCLYIDANLTAVGSKDGSLIFYDRNGNIIKAHQNVHKSPVCTLKLVNNGQYLASGSDHPNPQIILWNLNSYNFDLYCRLKQHKGAVTAVQCLQDNQHMVSGSYDKKLCVYSIPQKKLKYTLPSNKYSVTALTLNCTSSKLISCCLQNNSLNIWQIVRSPTLQGINKVQTIFLQQVVQNNTMICSVVSSAIRPNLVYIGTKDGRLKIVDIDKSQSVKNMNCCNNALIQMLVIEQNDGLPVILCWPCKQKCFKMVDCQTGKVINVNTRGQLDFSCGVGPKASGAKDGFGFVVCSQSDDREIYWYKINRII